MQEGAASHRRPGLGGGRELSGLPGGVGSSLYRIVLMKLHKAPPLQSVPGNCTSLERKESAHSTLDISWHSALCSHSTSHEEAMA